MVDTITHSFTQAGQSDRTDTMYQRMSRENSWPWVTDPEWWNENFPEHKVEINSIPRGSQGKSD